MTTLAILIASAFAVFAGPAPRAVHVQQEVARLETLARAGKLKAPQKARLAELYFLLSRCADVKQVAPGSPLACACGSECIDDTNVTKVETFRRLLEGGARWDDKRVRRLWDIVGNLPEARYWALKAMSVNRDPKLHALRGELERSLESLEVR